MNREQIHKALCELPETDKLLLSMDLSVRNIDIRDFETMLADVITGVQVAMSRVSETYKYLCKSNNNGSSADT